MITHLKIRRMAGIPSVDLRLKAATALAGRAGAGKTTVANAVRLVAAIHQRDGEMPTNDEPGLCWDRIENQGKPESGTTVELAGTLPAGIPDIEWKAWSYRCTAAQHLGLPLIEERLGVGRTPTEASGQGITLCESKAEPGSQRAVGRYRGAKNSDKWRQLEGRCVLSSEGGYAADSEGSSVIEYLRGLFKHRLAQSPATKWYRLRTELNQLWEQAESRRRLREEAEGLLPGPAIPNPTGDPDWFLMDAKGRRMLTSRMSSCERNAVALGVVMTKAMESDHRDNFYIIDGQRLDPDRGRSAQLAAIGRLATRGQVLIDLGPDRGRSAQLAAIGRLATRGQVLIDLADEVQGLPGGRYRESR